jgi:choline dehydrogenase
VVHDNPNVGRNLRDHWNYLAAFDLKYPRDGQNRQYRGWRLARNLARWFITGRGPLGIATQQVAAFAETEPGAGRADVELLFGAYTFEQSARGIVPTREPTMSIYSFPLRSTSEGSILIRSADPKVPAMIKPNYLATEYDRRVTVNSVHLIRKMVAQPPLARLVGNERPPSGAAKSDEEIIAVARQFGSPSMHTCGTCRMGPDYDQKAVLDTHLRVRGTTGLRVVDCSFFPDIVSANTNGPAMALAWRAADLIRADWAA